MTQAPSGDAALLTHARALHKQVPLIDGHNDYPWALRENAARDLDKLDIAKPQPSIMTDIARLRAGGVGGQFWSVYVPVDDAAPRDRDARADRHRASHDAQYPETFELALTADDIERIFKKGKIASLIGMEGGHSIDSSLGALRMFHRLGARYMTLTHSKNMPWADSATDTPVLERTVAVRRRGRARDELARHARRSVARVAGHDGRCDPRLRGAGDLLALVGARRERRAAQRARQHPAAAAEERRRRDGDVRAGLPLGEGRGLERLQDAESARLTKQFPSDAAAVKIGLGAWAKANPAPRATIADAADHIDHIKKVAGIDHIGLGGDFDGITSVVQGLEDVSTYPALTAELLRRGYKDDDIKKILGLNILRVMRGVEKVSARLQKERAASPLLFTK